MGLRGWSWDAAAGPAGAGNRPLLEALEVALPDAAVEEAIERTGTRERRRRVLPTHLVVTLVVAMGLWAEESVRHALAAVVDGWREARARRAAALGPPPAGPGGRPPWRLPSTAALVRARRRVGVRLFRELFHAVAGPLATPDTAGAFLGGLRLMAVDGTTLDVADTPANARAFGRPTTHRGARGLPPAAGGGPHRDGHPRPVRRGAAPVPRRRGPGRPAPAALGRPGHAAAVGPGLPRLRDAPAHAAPAGPTSSGRTKANVVLPPTEAAAGRLVPVRRLPLARPRAAGGRRGSSCAWWSTPWTRPRGRAPSATASSPRCSTRPPSPPTLLAATYHERWEVETALAEVKVHQWAHPRPLRSKHPRGVVQEVYGLLLAHLAIRTLMYQAALRDGVDPDRLSFTGALRVLRRAIPRAQRAAPKRLPLLPTGS